MTKKAKVLYNFSTSNPLDGRVFKSSVSHDAAVQVAVEYFGEKYSDRKTLCFDTYGRTWDAQYDAVLKALHQMKGQLDQAVKERDEAARQQRSLAAKLNAIVLVLRTDQ